MSTAQYPPPSGNDPIDGEVIELEPTIAYEMGSDSTAHPSPRVGVMEGSMASISSEMDSLRRSRLRSAALFFASVYGLMAAWTFFSDSYRGNRLVLDVQGARFVLAAAVGGLLLSRLSLSRGLLRAAEVALFGGMTALICASQYFVNIDLAHRGEIVATITHIKNGVINLLFLTIIYGMVIPNRPKVAATVVLSMTLVYLATFTMLMENPEALVAIKLMWSAEQQGTNRILILLGAALAIYGAYTLNNLRVELHEARKFGQYKLRQKIGEGGMGEVYLAEHELLKRPCALKLIRASTGDNPTALARFEREVQSAARLAHPNTIEIFDYGHTQDGTFYYVMEYLQGFSLADIIKEFGPLPPGRLIYLLRQVCAGLAEAHWLGLIHRDLKPANIFVAARGGEYDVAKVLDFGLVKLTQEPGAVELTADHTESGTPLFMSPEQATGDRSLDARSDIYSLGAIAYYALTGQPPFQGDSPVAVMIAHARDEVVPPSRHRTDAPADLEAVILRCLAKKPADRYSDVKALAKALAKCASAGDWDSDKAEQWWAAEKTATAAIPSAS